MPGCDGTGTAERSYPASEARGLGQEDLRPCSRGQVTLLRPGTATRRTYPTPKARGCGWEEPSHLQRAVAAQTQEGLEELFHTQGQKGQQ